MTITGSVAPGASVGIINVTGSLTLGYGAAYNWEVNGATGDLINVSENLTFGNGGLNQHVLLNTSILGTPAMIDYVIMHVDGNVNNWPIWHVDQPTGWAGEVVKVVAPDGDWDIVLKNYQFIPEPAGLALLGLALLGIRRKRS